MRYQKDFFYAIYGSYQRQWFLKTLEHYPIPIQLSTELSFGSFKWNTSELIAGTLEQTHVGAKMAWYLPTSKMYPKELWPVVHWKS